MKWVSKIIEQLNYELKTPDGASSAAAGGLKLSDERSTLLALIAVYDQTLIDIEGQPTCEVHAKLEAFAREITANGANADVLNRFHEFFAAYRTAEHAHVRKSFDDFKAALWNFVDFLGDEARAEQNEDQRINENLQALKTAVESNSLAELRVKSKQFIASYAESQSRRELRRSKKIRSIRNDLETTRKQLDEADRSLRTDHLTHAHNRRSFDERLRHELSQFTLDQRPCTLLALDIDFFKKVNDTYGHDVGDFMLFEVVRLLKECFARESDFVARVGGEEFCVVLGGQTLPSAVIRAEEALARFRKEVFVKDEMQLQITMSMGIAQLAENETAAQWIKRADHALYDSKKAGRDRFTVSALPGQKAA